MHPPKGLGRLALPVRQLADLQAGQRGAAQAVLQDSLFHGHSSCVSAANAHRDQSPEYADTVDTTHSASVSAITAGGPGTDDLAFCSAKQRGIFSAQASAFIGVLHSRSFSTFGSSSYAASAAAGPSSLATTASSLQIQSHGLSYSAQSASQQRSSAGAGQAPPPPTGLVLPSSASGQAGAGMSPQMRNMKEYFMRQSQMDSGDRSSYDDRMKALQLLASVMAEGFQQAAASGAAPYASVAASDASGDHAGAGAGSSSGEVMPQEYRPDAALMDQYFRTIDSCRIALDKAGDAKSRSQEIPKLLKLAELGARVVAACGLPVRDRQHSCLLRLYCLQASTPLVASPSSSSSDASSGTGTGRYSYRASAASAGSAQALAAYNNLRATGARVRLGDVMELSRVVAWDPQLTPEQAVAGAWRVIKEALDADPHTNASLSMAPARASSAAGRMGATSSSSSSAAAAAFVAADDRRQLAAQANDLMRQAVRNGLWDLYYELLGAVRSRGLLVEPDVWLDVLAGAARQDRLDWVRSTLAEIKSLSAATDNKTKSAPSSAAAKMARGIPEGVLLEVLNAAVRGADVELAQHVFGLMHVPAGSAAAAAPRTPSRASYLAYATLLARQRKWEDVLELMSSLADAHGLKSPARTARAAGGKDDGTEASAAAAASKEGSDDDDNEDVEGPASMAQRQQSQVPAHVSVYHGLRGVVEALATEEDAVLYFSELTKRIKAGEPVSAPMFNVILRAAAKKGAIDEVSTMVDQMTSLGHAANEDTYNVVMEASLAAGKVDRVDGVLALMRLDKVVPSPTTYNMLLRAAVAAADCEAVCKYVRHMQADGVFATRQVVLAAKELAEQLGNELAVTYTRQVLERPVERRDGGRGRNFY